MIVDIDHDAKVATKRAENEVEAERLRREARLLDEARHPGVTEPLASPVGAQPAAALRLRAVEGRPLGRLGPLTDGEIAGLGVVLATTLGDLHDLGIVHGAVAVDHVIVEPSGQPILCSLGRGRVAGDRDGAAPSDDVAGLASVLSGLLASGTPAERRDDLRHALTKMTRDPRRRPSARHIARRLARVPGATLPTGDRRTLAPDGARLPAGHGTQPAAAAATLAPGPRTEPARAGSTRPWRDRTTLAHAADIEKTIAQRARPRLARMALVLVAAGVGSTAIVVLRSGRPASRGCPAADVGCRPVPHPAGIVTTGTGRYAIGPPEDPVVIGRWHCRNALPALLRRATGQVWAFDSWSGPGGVVHGRPVARVDGALSLRVDPSGSGCDRLLVTREAGPPVGLDLARPASPATTGTKGADRTD